MAHQTKIKEALAKIKILQAELSNIQDMLEDMVPETKIAKKKMASYKTQIAMQTKILKTV